MKLFKDKIHTDIAFSFVFRALAAACSFILVPITLNYLDEKIYGLWLTIFAFINWTNVFDLGINNGLKTKLIYAFSQNDFGLARKATSTVYNLMLLIVSALIALLLISSLFVNWNEVFNYPEILDLRPVVLIPMVFFILKLYTDLIHSVILADRKTWVANTLYFLNGFASIAGVWMLTFFEVENRILWVAIVLGVMPFLVSLLSNVFFFTTIYKKIRPRFLRIDKTLIRGTLSNSLSFFIIQLSILVLMSTDNLIIIHLFTPEDVTVYSICYKFFTLFTIGWTTLIMPYWSAFGAAYYQNNFDWIRKTVRRLVRLWLLLNLALIATLVFVDDIYRLWVGEEIKVPFSLSVWNAVFISLFSLANIYIYFINGIGKIRFQLITSIIIGIANIPLAILFAKYLQLGLTGVMIATCLCIAVNPTFGYYQYKQLITGRAKGIWLK